MGTPLNVPLSQPPLPRGLPSMRLLTLLCLLALAAPALAQPVSILTQRYATDRLAWNRHETTLNAQTVTPNGFGLLCTFPVDDQVYAQPLVCSGLTINGAARNVVFVATVNNTLYAFDADQAVGATAVPIWQRNLSNAGMRAVRNTDMTGACGGNYLDFSGRMGIVGTPAIDSVTQTMYLVHREVTATGNPSFRQYLHAIDIATGAERPGSPTLIVAGKRGIGAGSTGGTVHFDPQKNNQRSALLLYNGIVYICWASHCDWAPYHGWMLGYDAATLARRVIYTPTPDGDDGGIWMSGCGPTVGPDGDIYLSTGNGTVGVGNSRNNIRNRGESLLRLRNVADSMQVVKFFTPANFQYLEDQDLDYGSDGAILIPGTRFVLSGSKDGVIYMTHADSMAGYSVSNASVVQQYRPNVQGPNVTRHMHGSPIYASYDDSLGRRIEHVFAWAESDSLKRLTFDRAAMRFDMARPAKGHVKLDAGMPGSMLAVSSNGQQNGSTLIWASHPLSGNANQQVRPGRLQAYDARDIARPLWSTDMRPARDLPGYFSKFNTPVVANGRVYMATFSSKINVYGILPATATRASLAVRPTYYLSPNPARDYIDIEANEPEFLTRGTLIMVDMLGRPVLCHVLAQGTTVVLPASLSAGVYTVRFMLDGAVVQTGRLVRE